MCEKLYCRRLFMHLLHHQTFRAMPILPLSTLYSDVHNPELVLKANLMNATGLTEKTVYAKFLQ